jgi:hypothetical protein
MSKKSIIVLIYHRHELLDLTNCMLVSLSGEYIHIDMSMEREIKSHFQNNFVIIVMWK